MFRDREGARPRFRRNPRLRYEAALRTLALVPRKAPDGVQYGGNQPTDISESNRRVYWPRLFSIPDLQRRHLRNKGNVALDMWKSYQRCV